MNEPNEPTAAELEGRALVLALTNPPFAYQQTEAAELVRSGAALGILARAVNEGTAGNVGIIEALANRVAAQAELLAKGAERRAKTSEPKAGPCYFVCEKCNGAFVFLKGDEKAHCGCGASRVEGSPLSLAFCTGFGPLVEVTRLVECGKLTVHEVRENESDRRIVLGVNNKAARGVDQPTASEAVARAVGEIERHAGAALAYLTKAAAAGASVVWSSHYHTEAAGVERTEAGEFLKRRLTGDARFCATVIARKKENELDGSLVFSDVNNCARCGGSHVGLAFWRLTNPVRDGAEVALTHYGNCPSNGEPILLFFTDEREAERVQGVRDMRAIDGPAPVRGPSPSGVKPVAGTVRAYEAGYDEGFADSYRTGRATNPYADGTREAAEWERGYKAGYKP